MSGNVYDASNDDRPRGILNKRERRYLRGESDIEPKSSEERAIRQAIRKHLQHALLDFQLIRRFLDERDRDQLVPDSSLRDGDTLQESALRGGLTSMLAFAFQLEDHEAEFAESLEYGIKWAVQESGWQAEVDVDIDLRRTERLDDIHERVHEEGGSALSTSDDLVALALTGRIGREEFRELKNEFHSHDE